MAGGIRERSGIRRALTEAIGSGQMSLALSLVPKIPAGKLSTESRLLVVTEAIKQRQGDRALQWLAPSGNTPDLRLFGPLITAWGAAERGDQATALATLDQISAKNPLSPLVDEQKALLLLKFRRPADAEPFARRAIAAAGQREARLRLAFADGFLAAGDRARAMATVQSLSSDSPGARRILAGRSTGEAIDTSAKACRASRLLQPWRIRKIAAWVVSPTRHKVESRKIRKRMRTTFTVDCTMLCTIRRPT